MRDDSREKARFYRATRAQTDETPSRGVTVIDGWRTPDFCAPADPRLFNGWNSARGLRFINIDEDLDQRRTSFLPF